MSSDTVGARSDSILQANTMEGAVPMLPLGGSQSLDDHNGSDSVNTTIDLGEEQEREQQKQRALYQRGFDFISGGGVNHDGVNVVVCHGCRVPEGAFNADREQSEGGCSLYVEDMLVYVQCKLEELGSKGKGEPYAVVYFHAGLKESPPLWFLRMLHERFTREDRKNLRAVYLVHPTDSLAALVAVVKTFVSSKVWQKVHFVPNVKTLRSYVIVENMTQPLDKEVKKEDLCRQWSWNGWGLW
eukprot:Nk52_evm68s208 gene=Nk52_evmTU68s208